jgi:hypothetical protein
MQLNKWSLVFMYNYGELSVTLDTNLLVSWVVLWANRSNDWWNFCSCTSIFMLYPQSCLRCKSRQINLCTRFYTCSNHTTILFSKKDLYS